MRIKPGVNMTGIKPEMVPAMLALARIFDLHGVVPVITSALDGRHGRGSLHYAGLAIDVRSKNLPDGAVKLAVLQAIKDDLGAQYDVLLEAVNQDNEHYHIEFQPKA